jgi:hypothetical protein
VGKKENPIMDRAWVAMVAAGARLWRNNVGTFFQGEAQYVREDGELFRLSRGDVVLRKKRVVKCGLLEGSSDLVGAVPIIVTQEMVGHTVAVFCTPEAKRLDGHPTKEQRSWIEMVNGIGGIAFVFDSVESARELLAAAVKRIRRV